MDWAREKKKERKWDSLARAQYPPAFLIISKAERGRVLCRLNTGES